MSENLSSTGSDDAAATAVAVAIIEQEAGISTASRNHSPESEDNFHTTDSMEILERSMESLIVSSDSAEEGILNGACPEIDEPAEGATAGDNKELESNRQPVELEPEALEVENAVNVAAKPKKRRISSRRTRTVKLSESDTVMCEIAGVQMEVIKQGFLLQHGSFQRWYKRYFTLAEDKLFVSKKEDEKLKEEIILKDMTIAENSSKNVNHSFTVLTPYQQEVVLAASSRKEMEEWVGAFKLAASKSKHAAMLDTLQHLQGQHSWFACTHSRPTYCNVCREALHGVAWHGLSCEVCKFKSHRRCVFRVNQVCKWTTRSSLQDAGVELRQDLNIPHQWLEGNLPAGSKCSVCDRTCGSLRRLQDYRCLWCKYTVHTECKDKMEKICTLGGHCLSILPPSALQRSDVIRKGMWEPYQVYGHSPVLACANSKSGENLGVKFLRRLKFWLNPTQVFDLAITGPDLGLQLFQRFEKFRIIVLGGDGSIGWVLSTVDKYNLHSKCMVGVVPLGTGNDMARVLGWGAQCREEEKLPSILSEMEHSSFKLLDRWSLQYTSDMNLDLSTLFGPHSPPKHRSSAEATTPHQADEVVQRQTLAPFPSPGDRPSGSEVEIVSPADSVFSRQDSDSYDDYKSAPDQTPSPDIDGGVADDIDETPDIGVGGAPNGDGVVARSDERAGQDIRSSPQNTMMISEFHKSLSGLAHTFSSILISEDEKNVLKSADILGGVVKTFLSSVLADMESELTVSDFESDSLVQKCVVLQDKLARLVAAKSDESPPTERKFIQREVLMARGNSLKKAIRNVIDVTEKALDAHAEDMDEIRQLASEISFKSTASAKPKGSVSSISSVVEPVPLLPEMKEVCVMNNYFGLGLDAKITYQFNTTREKNPAQFKSRAKNMMLYGILGGKEFLTNSQRYLERRIRLECDGEPVELPQRLQGLVFLNIPSYMAGTNFWGTEREKDGFSAPSHDDKLMEVVAVSGFTSIATAKVLGIQNHRLRQCRFAKVALSEEMPVQVDGEAWLQKPGMIVLSHKNKARMLVKDKAFSQTLESWKQKHSASSSQLPLVPPPVTSTLHQSLSTEELNRYRELAAAVPPLVSYIKAESTVNNDVLRDLVPYVSSATQSLHRIFLEGGLVSDTANILHLQDFERDLKALLQETLWFLSMQRISSENDPPLREAVRSVEGNMKRLLSANLSACSQAHHMFRRGSDTLLLTPRPQYRNQQSSPELPPHRERSAHLVPDDTIQAVGVIRKIGKEVGLWDEDDVCQWLEGIELGDYTQNFIQQNVVGSKLLQLRKSDFQDLGVTKVGHSTRLYRALQALTGDSPSPPGASGKTQRPGAKTEHHRNRGHH